jgi:hypothetical protein
MPTKEKELSLQKSIFMLLVAQDNSFALRAGKIKIKMIEIFLTG